MDATPASSNGNGFDAALKALDDLETSVVQTREEKPATPAAPPEPAIGFSDVEEDGEPAAITAVPIAEQVAIAAVPVAEPVPAAPPIVVAPAPSSGRLGRIAIGISLLSSLLSAAGLIVAERTIMSAQLVVASARERAEQFEQSNKLIRELEVVRAKQIELLQAQQAQLANAPISSAELQARIDNLQKGLLARDPLHNVVSAIRESQSDTNSRFNEFGMKIARVEAMLERH